MRVGTSADAALIDALADGPRATCPCPRPAPAGCHWMHSLAQGGQGLCLIDSATADAGNPPGEASPNSVHCPLPVTLIHSLSTGGRVALATEWWGPADASGVGGVARGLL